MYAILLFVVSIHLTSAFMCEDDWIQYYEYCYYKLDDELSYRDAIDHCAQLHSDMLTINTKKEESFVSKYFLTKYADVWLDAMNSNYDNWYNHTNPQSKCAIVHQVKKHEGKWFEEDCDNENEVVCKTLAKDREVTSTTESNDTTETTPTKTTIITTEPTTQPTTQDPRCPQKWIYFNKKCYQVIHQNMTGNAAAQNCRQWKATLTSIHSKAENEFINGLLNKHGHTFAIIGLNRLLFILPFWWDDGTAPDYWNWQTGCPNKFSEQSFSMMRRYGGTWCDIHWTEAYPSVCAFPLV